jgi:hypothetical protein
VLKSLLFDLDIIVTPSVLWKVHHLPCEALVVVKSENGGWHWSFPKVIFPTELLLETSNGGMKYRRQ